MEDYKEKYEMALEGIQEILSSGQDSIKMPQLQLRLQGIFPELKNKDEEIRKALIEMVHDTTGDELWVDYNVHKEEALDWLEKQGSSSVKWQKNTSDNKPTINHSVLMKTTQGIAEGYFVGSLWFQFRWSSNIKDSDVLAWMELSDLDEQGEQKPVIDFKASNWYVSKVDGKIHVMTYNPTDKVEPRFKVVKYAGSEYNVLEVRDIAGVTFYGIEDEPNHIDYVKAENCEIIEEI